ncbi:MAG: LysR family transcriptional regulator [Gordonia sp. (in: high G+C Gram-positive bacteria)]|nr:MAG: LysR family transcriptional regulator [Gordonia sp. (in: high G+C Gram-positive bacteria)]
MAQSTADSGSDNSTTAAEPIRRKRSSVDTRRIRADDLRYLLVVARTGRRAAAASDLGVDHSTVTRRIRALEQTLGVRLIERGADGWELTDIGRDVAATAAPIEAAVERAADTVTGNSTESLRGTVRITAPDAFGTYFVAPALAKMRTHHPHLTVELMTATRQLNLHQSGFDVAIAVGAPMSSRLVSETITQYALGLYATEDYLAEFGEPATAEDVREHPLIWFIDSLLQVGDLDLDKHLPGASAKFMSTNVLAHVEATRAGGGIGLLPAFLAIRHPDLKRVLPATVDVRIAYSLAARRESLSSPAVRAIRAAIHAEVQARVDELLPPPA